MIGVNTAGDSYQHRVQRLRAELADARAAVRRGEGDPDEVRRLALALESLQADARQSGISL
jgi:hypothetical protein